MTEDVVAGEQLLMDLPPEPEQTVESTNQEEGSPPEIQSKDEDLPEQTLGAEGAETEEEEAPQYDPNYKYNVQGKEFEFDERLRGIIKDKDSEEYVRDLVTKAEGLDTYKAKLSEREQSFNEMQDQFGEVKGNAEKYELGFQRLEQLKNSDLSSFAKTWGITDSQIVDLAKNIIQQDENPSLAQQRQTQFDNIVQSWQHQDQQRIAQNQMSQESTRLHAMEMELAFTKPEVSDFQQRFDQAKGKEGAFKDLVNTYGSAQWNQGRQLTPRDCVKAVMDEFGVFVAPKQEPQQSTVQPQAGQPQGTANPKPLPNMGSGRTGSPVKKKVSWDELNKMAGLR